MTGGKCGRNVTWLLSGDTFIVSGTGAMYDYSSAPDRLVRPWKDDICKQVRKIIISDGVTTIGNFAFVNFVNLSAVTIPDSVIKISIASFGDCTRLTKVTIPDSVTTIGYSAFRNCTNLTNVTIGNGVTTIDKNSFWLCDSLTNVKIPAAVMSIGEAFVGCTNLKEIHYPAGRGFEKNLSQGNNAKLIPYNVTPPAVTQPKPTTQTVTRPTAQPVAEKLTWSFAGKTLTVGGVREIKFFPYSKIPWLKHLHDIQRIVVGDGVEKIAAQAFEECKRLEMVTLPASVKTIGDMFSSLSFCGDRSVNGGRNVFWCLEDGVLVLKKNPAAVGEDFSTGFASWTFADKNIRGVKLETGIKPTEKFFAWLSSHDGAAISFV